MSNDLILVAGGGGFNGQIVENTLAERSLNDE